MRDGGSAFRSDLEAGDLPSGDKCQGPTFPSFGEGCKGLVIAPVLVVTAWEGWMAWAWDVMMSWTLDPSLGLEHGLVDP